MGSTVAMRSCSAVNLLCFLLGFKYDFGQHLHVVFFIVAHIRDLEGQYGNLRVLGNLERGMLLTE